MPLAELALETHEGEIQAAEEVRVIRQNLSNEGDVINENGFEDNEIDATSEFVTETLLRPEYYSLPFFKRPYPITVLIILFLGFLSDAIGSTAQLDFAREIACRARFPDEPRNPTICNSPVITGDIGWILNVITAIISACSLFVAPRITAASDRLGRKSLLLLNLFTSSIGSIFSLMIYFHMDKFGYRALFLSTIIANICGGVVTMVTLIKSYFSDCLQPIHRARYFSYISGSNSVALAVGPTLGSLVTQWFKGDITPVIVISSLSAVVLLFLFALIPESRDVRQRRFSQSSYSSSKISEYKYKTWNWRWWVNKIMPVDQLEKLKFSRVDSKIDRRNVHLLLWFSFLQGEIINGIIPLLLLYPQRMFGWTSVETGFFLSEFGLLQTFALLVLMPFLLKIFSRIWHTSTKRLDAVDVAFIKISLTGFVLSQAAILLATGSLSYMVGSGLMPLCISGPIIASAIIKFIPKNEVGETLGALGFLTNLGNIAAPFVFMEIFNMTIETRPTTVFYFTLFLFLSLLVMSGYLKPVRTEIDDVRHVFRLSTATERSSLFSVEEEED